METAILAALGLAQTMLTQFGAKGSVAGKALIMLEQVIPIATTLGPSVVQSVHNIIGALRSSDDLTSEQLEALDALSAELDANYDAAIAAYMVSKGGR